MGAKRTDSRDGQNLGSVPGPGELEPRLVTHTDKADEGIEGPLVLLEHTTNVRPPSAVRSKLRLVGPVPPIGVVVPKSKTEGLAHPLVFVVREELFGLANVVKAVRAEYNEPALPQGLNVGESFGPRRAVPLWVCPGWILLQDRD